MVPSIVSILSALLVILCVLRLLNWVWIGPKRLERCLRQQGLSGNPYRLVFGDLNESSAMRIQALSAPISLSDDHVSRVLPFVDKTLKKYGRNSFIWNGMTPSVNIFDPDLIREIMTKYEDYRRPKINFLAKLLMTGLVSYEGDQWVKHRKIINPAFHLEKLKKMSLGFYLGISEMLIKWDEIVSENGSCELDVWPYLQIMSADVISRTAFSGSYNDGRRIFQLLKEQTDLIGTVIRLSHIPGWRYLPTNAKKRMYQIDSEIETLLRGIINKREEEMKAGEPSKDDLLGILMESNLKEIQEPLTKKNGGLSIKEVIAECKLFYFGGQDTTADLLVWTMVLLSGDPNWQARAREEVLQVFGKNKPNIVRFNDLKIVTMILYEVLRLYPPGSSSGRRVHKNIKLGKMFLPKGVLLQMQLIMVNHDPKIWGDDVKEFKPERFAKGISSATNGRVSFFPFGWGPRICIGQNFALIEAKMALSMILQQFSFELSPSYTHAPHLVITLQPQHGAHLVLHKI